MYIPFGYSVDIYDGDGYTGDYITVTGQYYTDTHMSPQCINIDATALENRDGSMVIYRTNQMGAAKGRWIGYTSTETINFIIHYGFETAHSAEETISQQYTMSYEMTTGIEFEGLTESETLALEYQSGIQIDTE